jgi:hypothetical protein
MAWILDAGPPLKNVMYLNSNGFTKFLECTIVFDSFLEGCSSTGSRMVWPFGNWINCRKKLKGTIVVQMRGGQLVSYQGFHGQ